jgi:hypothetical protein
MQALVLLNDVQYVEAARAAAEWAIKSPDGFQQSFIRLAGRKPTPREITILKQTYEEQKAIFAKDPPSATKLMSLGESKPDPKINPIELAAMTVTVQTILSSDAVIWKR